MSITIEIFSAEAAEPELAQTPQPGSQSAVDQLDFSGGDLEIIATADLDRLVNQGFTVLDESLYPEVRLTNSALVIQQGSSDAPQATGTSCSFPLDMQMSPTPAALTVLHAFVERARDDSTCRRVIEVGAMSLETYERLIGPFTGGDDGPEPRGARKRLRCDAANSVRVGLRAHLGIRTRPLHN